MKTQYLNRKIPALFALMVLALGSLFWNAGCIMSSDTEAQAEIAGVLQGDVHQGAALGKSATEVEGAVVTLHEVSADGVVGPAVAQTQTDVHGSFVLKTNLKGPRALIVRAVQSGTEWSARFEGTLQAGTSAHTRPLNLESSIAASVWLELQKTPEGRAVHASEVSLTVDSGVAACARGEFRGSDTARVRILQRLAKVVREGSQAREAVTAAVYARAEAAQARVAAEAAFNAELQAAGTNDAQATAAHQAYVHAVIAADVNAGLDVVIAARSREAAYQAMIIASAREQISDSARTALARNCARILATVSDTALQAQFAAAGAASTQVQGVAQAGVTFQAEIGAAVSAAQCDSALAHYRAHARQHFDSAFISLSATLQTVASAMDSLSVALDAGLNSDTSGAEVGEAYADAHADARARVILVLTNVVGEAQASATADVVAFLKVHAGS